MNRQASRHNRIVVTIRTVAGNGSVVLHDPSFAGNEWYYLKECLDSTFVSSDCPRINLAIVELLAQRLINIPSSPGLVPATR